MSGSSSGVRVGNYAESTVPRTAEALEMTRLELAVQKEGGDASERTVTLEGDVVRVGSHPSNDVVLRDRLVSRFHCRIHRGAHAWMVTDMGSLNGTRVNGVPVRDADLTLPECRIELGESTILMRESGRRPIAPPSSAIQFGAICGISPAMRKLFGLLERVARSDATLLIEGESGTGKELVTAEVVRRSARATRPFLVVDCGTISTSVVESELFGHARGAFTGADRQRVGAFEAADGGTVFLDEVGELPLDMQPKLLRVLENGEVRRMGENHARKVDVRVIAATNRQLEREVNRGRFREDLFFRLSVLTVRVPPLRDRKEDIPILLDALLISLGAIDQRALFTPELMESMEAHDWPGNVRELKNFIGRRILLDETELGRRTDDQAPSSRGEPRSLGPKSESGLLAAFANVDKPFHGAKEELVETFERTYLAALMKWADGNVSRAARKAKIDRMHLHRLLQHHRLRKNGSLHD